MNYRISPLIAKFVVKCKVGDCGTSAAFVVRTVKESVVMKRLSSSHGGVPAKKPAGHWSIGLKASMEDPELKVEDDDKIVIIKDKYPKAKYHFLVLPKENIASMKILTKDHIPLLKHMEKKGRELTQKTSATSEFRYGYHAIPSMSHIHLHVISQDFDSPSLKTKKHWNSFTSEYFIDSQDVIEKIEKNGNFKVDTSRYEEILKQPLKCHKCKKDLSTMPALKQHILSHIKK